MSGVLYGVGVGPGDPDLMTLKARDVIAAAPAIAYIHATGRNGIARKIAAPHVGDGVKEIAIAVPMAADEEVRRQAYDDALPAIEAALAEGDVAFLCEGDPLFYGSFIYVLERLRDTAQVEVVPGVGSIMAAAAAANAAIVTGDAPFTVLPATLPEAALKARASQPGALACMKVGRNLDKVKRVLEHAGRLEGAVFIERASTPDEKVQPLREVEAADYFSLILVPAGVPLHARAPEGAAIVCVSASGLDAARALRAALPGSTLLGRRDRVNAEDADELFDDTLKTLQAKFQTATPIVAVMASGIVVRALAPLLIDKEGEPPVIAISADGAHAVPLLGGHGGGNRLAQACSQILGGQAAITTGGDAILGLALDDPPPGWHVANRSAAKAVAAKLLSGEGAPCTVDSGSAAWLSFPRLGDGPGVRVTHKLVEKTEDLLLHPPTLVLGLGCERGAEPSEVIALAEQTIAEAGLAKQSIACVASIDLKSDEDAILAAAKHFGVPARFFTADKLEAETPRLVHPSNVVFAEVGCHGVSEGAALAAVGAEGTLLVAKHKTKRATCAVGLSQSDIDPLQVGRGQGRLFVVGIGPGQDAWRTPEATRALSEATDIVGYGLYLDLVEDLIAGKNRHTSELSQEEARVRRSLELAAEGRDVALVSSGDIGIYAMAALVFELLDFEDDPAWNRIDIRVMPGISAFQAAAARIGAPVGHDFCLISLSDLLTPWQVIERRLHAAAVGGFTVALYNPVSKRRRTQLAAARDILLTKRRPDTPVILARNLGREGETVTVLPLKDLEVDMVDMLTLVMIGGEDTRLIERGHKRWVYTPRGYGQKMTGENT